MNLDDLIAALLEAKEHCVDGRSTVFLKNEESGNLHIAREVKFDSNNCFIYYV